MRIPLSSLALLPLLACSQYNGPESVEYDPTGDRYFVSNTGDGTIKQRDQLGAVTAFASVSPSPYGLEILGDTLYACSGGSVKGYLLSTGALVANVNVGGAFLNGITTDGTYLYVTDFSDEKILRVDPAAGTFTTWVANTNGTPNGIAYDATNDLLAVAFWGGNAAVKTYDRTTAALGWSTVTGVGSIDGIAVDCLGNYLIASWSPDRITRFEPLVVSPLFVDLQVPGLNNPADIDFDAVHDVVCIPNSAANTVTLHSISCINAVPETNGTAPIELSPNPTDGLLWWKGSSRGNVPYTLTDAAGRAVRSGTWNTGVALDLGSLVPGVYTMSIALEDGSKTARQVVRR
ncbi:MAG: T9SS type A sorting domain-containing protein [Flavobacteriales bacterium]|nr:T9SS type A sorting domain-containing protein [Flavobacteriales bacterium]